MQTETIFSLWQHLSDKDAGLTPEQTAALEAKLLAFFTSDASRQALCLKSMRLTNYKMFGDVSVDFHEKLTVFHGANGTGKSSILRCLARTLSWITLGVRNGGTSGGKLTGDEVRAVTSEPQPKSADVQTRLSFYGTDVNPVLRASPTGSPEKARSEVQELKIISDILRRANAGHEALVQLPLLLYFPTDRTVVFGKNAEPKNFAVDLARDGKLHAYDKCLTETARSSAFVSWVSAKYKQANAEGSVKRNALKAIAPVTAKLKALWPQFEGFVFDQSKGYDELHLRIENAVMDASQLSDGQRMLLFLFGEIAWRLTELNPGADNPLEGNGIVLIDEIELHMHPLWQQKVIGFLLSTFPNVQFVVTTHSPQVISTVRRESVREIPESLDGGQPQKLPLPPEQTRSFSSDEILQMQMGVSKAPTDFEEGQWGQKCQQLMMTGQLAEAEALLSKIKAYFGPGSDQAKTLGALLTVMKRKGTAS